MSIERKHYALVDPFGGHVRFVGEHVGQNRRGDDFYVSVSGTGRTLIVVDNRDGSPLAVAPEAEADVVRGLLAAGERDLADRLTEKLELRDLVPDLV